VSARVAGLSAVALLALALALGGCGRKGDLRAPEGEESAYTGLGVYPAPDTVVPPGPEDAPEDAPGNAPEDAPGAEGDSGEEGTDGP
jgi:hypothetical protein